MPVWKSMQWKKIIKQRKLPKNPIVPELISQCGPLSKNSWPCVCKIAPVMHKHNFLLHTYVCRSTQWRNNCSQSKAKSRTARPKKKEKHGVGLFLKPGLWKFPEHIVTPYTHHTMLQSYREKAGHVILLLTFFSREPLTDDITLPTLDW